MYIAWGQIHWLKYVIYKKYSVNIKPNKYYIRNRTQKNTAPIQEHCKATQNHIKYERITNLFINHLLT